MKNPKSKTPSPDSARSVGYLLVSGAALVVVTCAGAARAPRTASLGPGKSASSAGAGALPSASAAPSPPAPDTDTVAVFGDRLGRFRGALADLAAKRRTEPVHVLWLGDSHTAADFWPDALRKPLEQRYGTTGPGFVHVGLNAYRHGSFKLGRDGTFRVEPKQPSLWTRQNDGVFGLGGIRVVPMDAKSRATLELKNDVAGASYVNWDLAFRLPTKRARFRVTVGGTDVKSIDGTKFPAGAIEHVEWRASSNATVTVDGAAGEPEIFGAVVESGVPGVVVDTLGINGARLGTPLAWDDVSWTKEVMRRKASLFVLAYGTNEAGDQVTPDRYGVQLESLVARVRKGAPGADCLVLGPTDREASDWTTLPTLAGIDDTLRAASGVAGCAYFSVFHAMGGDGSLKRWADLGLGAPDHIHLTPRGYAELGAKVSDFVLGK